MNVYIIYELDTWPKTPLNNFKLKICLFVAINVVKNSDKAKSVYSGYRIAFDWQVCGVLVIILIKMS